MAGRWKEWKEIERGERVSYLEKEVRDRVRERRVCVEGMAMREKERDNERRNEEDFV